MTELLSSNNKSRKQENKLSYINTKCDINDSVINVGCKLTQSTHKDHRNYVISCEFFSICFVQLALGLNSKLKRGVKWIISTLKYNTVFYYVQPAIWL